MLCDVNEKSKLMYNGNCASLSTVSMYAVYDKKRFNKGPSNETLTSSGVNDNCIIPVS